MTPRFPYSRHRHGTPSPQTPALECQHVTIQYPRADQPAVRDVSLRVPSGARVALVGANGAGKSTLLKATAGLLPVTSGKILVHGSPPRGCCHRVAYLAQRGDLDWRFPISVRHLVLTGRFVHLGWFRRPTLQDQQIIDRMMELLQISDLADRAIGELSGGQQQRTLLARAMAQEADMLLLDEPMNAVDTATRQIIRRVLRDLSAAGKTIVAATHDPHDIQFEFEKVIHLSCGCKEDAGSIESVEELPIEHIA
ncbi:MAG TPA: ABC transporter ATP-binding protein [Tepidisphaeraceae bacterium]|jgi:manganese/zinc/iron transport system ATP- binding protein